jgi:hypothetical protein
MRIMEARTTRTARVRIIWSAVTAMISILLMWPSLASPKGPRNRAAAAERERAVKLWNEAIAAKGGRERLLAVKNLVVDQIFPTRLHPHGKERTLTGLYVFPHLAWDYGHDSWSSGRSVILRIWNGNLGRTYFCRNEPKLFCSESKEPLGQLIEDLGDRQTVWLMETRWVKPQPVKAWTQRVGWRKVDVVETEVNNAFDTGTGETGNVGETEIKEADKLKVRYFLDRSTHLPVKITYDVFVKMPQASESGWLHYEFRLRNYEDVAGIKLPRDVWSNEGADDFIHERDRYEINVQYDPRVFVCKPRISDGPDGFRPGRCHSQCGNESN